MKKFLCIIMTVAMVFGVCACSKKIVVNKKPHVESADMEYDKTEIIADDEFYYYCGTEYDLISLVEHLSFEYQPDTTYNIVCKDDYQDRAMELFASLTEIDFTCTVNGANPNEKVSENGTPNIITE